MLISVAKSVAPHSDGTSGRLRRPFSVHRSPSGADLRRNPVEGIASLDRMARTQVVADGAGRADGGRCRRRRWFRPPSCVRPITRSVSCSAYSARRRSKNGILREAVERVTAPKKLPLRVTRGRGTAGERGGRNLAGGSGGAHPQGRQATEGGVRPWRSARTRASLPSRAGQLTVGGAHEAAGGPSWSLAYR